jgi:hypothetical protein
MLDENLALPFETKVLGVSAVVVRVDLTAADEIVAVCRSGATPSGDPDTRAAASHASAQGRGMD